MRISFTICNRKYYFSQVLLHNLYRLVNHFGLNKWKHQLSCCIIMYLTVWLILLFSLQFGGFSSVLETLLSLCFCCCLFQWHHRFCYILDKLQIRKSRHFKWCCSMNHHKRYYLEMLRVLGVCCWRDDLSVSLETPW